MRACLVLFAFLFISSSAQAQNDLGIGIMLGEPSGISAKQWISRTTAIDAGFAWSFANDTAIQLHADYLRHRVYLFETDDFESRIPVYYGLGVKTTLGDDPTVGIRFPVGVGKTFRDQPVELFLEIVPILDIAPNSDFAINAAIGARYYFNR
jgi:hypothetical protein